MERETTCMNHCGFYFYSTTIFLPVQKSDVPCDIVVFRERTREKFRKKISFPSSFFAAWTSGEIARLLEILLNTQIRRSPLSEP